MEINIKRLAWQIIGVILLLAGLVGLFLPFLQGIILILVGLFILSMISPRLKENLHGIRRLFPKIHARILVVEEKIDRKIGHWFR